MRTKKQGTHLTLNEHDDDDNEEIFSDWEKEIATEIFDRKLCEQPKKRNKICLAVP